MNQRTVLIVDDDRITREQLEKELKRNFFTTKLADNARGALEVIDQEEINIMLIDIKLPDQGMDGLDVLRAAKQKRPNCEVIVITGFGNQEIAIRSLKAGAIDYIEKPIKMDELAAALGRAQEKLTEKEELTYTLLVIDDEIEIVERLQRILKKEDYEVFGACSGEEGLKIIKNNKIDVLITDIQMGDMDGIAVLKKAKEFYQDIEGIVVTGFNDQKLAIKSLRAGAIDYITKPVDLDELLFSVQKAIERINLNRNRLYRNRELKISSEIISKMNEELERKISERTNELNRTQSQLFQTSKLATLGEMAAGLAHEMNQPLGGISLVARHFRKLVERDKLTLQEIDSGLSDIEGSVKRMTKIIQHIRTFARQDTLKFVLVNINDTIESALSLLGEQMRLHQVEIINDLGDNLPRIAGEPYQLEQVWINLISNARDAVDEKEKQIADGRL